MLMNVKAEHGFLGDCGVFYKIALGDTYTCFEKKLNVIATCVRNFWTPNVHKHICCPEPVYCEDWRDEIIYDFGPVI